MTSGKRLFSLGLFALFAVTFFGGETRAADPACDPKFMDALKERAWMEAQREMMMNETFIWKPDSVLALSCFSGAIATIPIGFASGNPLQQASDNAADWLSSNFSHALGGGNTGDFADPTQLPAACTKMYDLWMLAKCEDLEVGQFISFSDFAGGKEPRIAPAACPAPPPPPQVQPSTNFTDYLADIGTVGLAAGGAAVPFDSINLFLGVTAPSTDAVVVKCNAGIKTGIKVTVGGNSLDEIVCSNPGCSPAAQGGVLKCCVVDAAGNANKCQ